MEKDKYIKRLIKESGLASAPENFTENVMKQVGSVSEKTVYRPLIGFGGQLFIILSLIGFIVISMIFSEPSTFLAERNIKLPDWNFNIENLSNLLFSPGLLAALVAVFILVLADNVIRKRRLA